MAVSMKLWSGSQLIKPTPPPPKFKTVLSKKDARSFSSSLLDHRECQRNSVYGKTLNSVYGKNINSNHGSSFICSNHRLFCPLPKSQNSLFLLENAEVVDYGHFNSFFAKSDTKKVSKKGSKDTSKKDQKNIVKKNENIHKSGGLPIHVSATSSSFPSPFPSPSPTPSLSVSALSPSPSPSATPIPSASPSPASGVTAVTRRLILLRHAKSSWADTSLKDHDRPLSKRGVLAAKNIALKMKEIGWIPDLILCSDSLRTRQTLEWMGNSVEEFKYLEVRFLGSYYSVAAMDGQTADHLRDTVLKFTEYGDSSSNSINDGSSNPLALSSPSSSSPSVFKYTDGSDFLPSTSGFTDSSNLSSSAEFTDSGDGSSSSNINNDSMTENCESSLNTITSRNSENSGLSNNSGNGISFASSGRNLGVGVRTVMCMGHNRGWEEAASVLSGNSVELKTANAALLESRRPHSDWREAWKDGFRLLTVIKPDTDLD